MDAMDAMDEEQDEEQTVPAVEVPPGPWRWVEVGGAPMAGGSNSGASAEPTELVAADGTRVIWSRSDGVLQVAPAARELIAQAHLLRRLPGLLEDWEAYRESCTPIDQASCLLDFANALTHLIWDYRGDLDDPLP